MKPFLSLLSTFALCAPALAQAPTPAADARRADAKELVFEVRALDFGVEHRLTGTNEIFLGAVMISLSPKVAPYAPGLPPSLTEFVTLGACFGKGGDTFVFTTPVELIPYGVMIHAQAALLDRNGLQVSQVECYTRLDTGVVERCPTNSDG